MANTDPTEGKPQGQDQGKAEPKPKGEGKSKGEGKPKGDKAKGEKTKGEGKAKGEQKGEGKAKGDDKPKEKKPIPKPRLLVRYQQEIGPALREALKKSNVMAVPRLSKVVLSMGLGKAVQEGGAKSVETKRFQDALNQMSAVAGQKPVVTRARKSVSQFKVREGWPVGLKVTLRGAQMWEFLDRLINLAIPRIRDFRGLDPKGFDGRGNYNMGVTEQSVFPEIDASLITYQQGMNVTVCTTSKNDTEAFELLHRMGMPFRS
jgi:large subunit ribosomal protein L5